jgi:cytochrome oxidase Cu insertion factor (SCO1/SenC/PrrC family)
MTRGKYITDFVCQRGYQNCFLAAIACCLFYLAVSVADAQLGPKDGTNLPATDLERVKIGDTAPDFTLESMDGRRITLSEVYRDRNVVLVFYRGQW